MENDNANRNTENESVAKVYKLNIPQAVVDSLSDVCNLEYDYFALYEQHSHLMLPYLLCYLFDQYNMFQALKIDPKVLHNLVEKIGQG